MLYEAKPWLQKIAPQIARNINYTLNTAAYAPLIYTYAVPVALTLGGTYLSYKIIGNLIKAIINPISQMHLRRLESYSNFLDKLHLQQKENRRHHIKIMDQDEAFRQQQMALREAYFNKLRN